jgi:hypothetical protein
MNWSPPCVGSVGSVESPPSDAFDASDAWSLSGATSSGLTVEDVRDVFGGRIIATTAPPITAGHVPLYELARAHGFPWLRVRPGLAIGRGEDAWHAWLEGWVSPAELVMATHRLVRGEGLA